MEYFLVRYDSRVIIYERKMFIRLATDWAIFGSSCEKKILIKVAQTFGQV